MTKWNEPPGPIPSWLDPTCEITAENDTKPTSWLTKTKDELRPLFVIACFLALRTLGLNHAQALGVLANSVVETGWGTEFHAWNLGGWKIHHSDVIEALAKGKKPYWSRAPGNKESLDPPWCFYRGFQSLGEFFSEWLLRFVPKPGTVPATHLYFKTGQAFWAGGEWFRELCLAGYKGTVTEEHPEHSIEGHHQIIASCLVFLCQHALNLDVDGHWGPKSIAACKTKQHDLGLPETGEPDLALLERLL